MNRTRAEDRAVHRDKRQEHTERVVEERYEPIEEHLENLHHRRDHADIRQQPEEAQIEFRKPGPRQRAFPKERVEDQIVDWHRDPQHDHHGDAEADGRADLLGNRDERAHSEEEGERHVLDEHRTDEESYR
jgi:hypothetical protein